MSHITQTTAGERGERTWMLIFGALGCGLLISQSVVGQTETNGGQFIQPTPDLRHPTPEKTVEKNLWSLSLNEPSIPQPSSTNRNPAVPRQAADPSPTKRPASATGLLPRSGLERVVDFGQSNFGAGQLVGSGVASQFNPLSQPKPPGSSADSATFVAPETIRPVDGAPVVHESTQMASAMPLRSASAPAPAPASLANAAPSQQQEPPAPTAPAPSRRLTPLEEDHSIVPARLTNTSSNTSSNTSANNRLIAIKPTQIQPPSISDGTPGMPLIVPAPLDCWFPGSASTPFASQQIAKGPRAAELLHNGGDRGKRVMVDSSFNIYNLDSSDTIGHFDTLEGQRLVATSNKVTLYAPRFAAVRRVDGLVKAQVEQKAGAVDERTGPRLSMGNDFSTTTKQHLGVDQYEATKRASGFIDQNRGLVADNVLPLAGARNIFEPYENLSLIRWGKHVNSESTRLGMGMQSANVWQDNLGLQISVNGLQPVIVNDVYKVQQIVRIDTDDRQAVLRVAKVASKMTALPGEIIEFTIRFDNLSGRRIGNVTIVDNLSGRLDYVADSAECSLEGTFSANQGAADSLILKWEITDPMPANTGGVIRFRCRVR